MDLNGSSFIYIIGFSKSMEKEWHSNYEFLIWEYGKHYLKQFDIYQLHCCPFVLGSNCDHSHEENSCVKCLTRFSFFKRKVCLS